MSPRSGGLEPGLEARLLDDPDDREAWAVYADWLGERGDPRGELIALELEVEAAVADRRRPSPEVAARYAALARDGPERWLGAALAEPGPGLAIEWRRAAPYRVVIAAQSTAEIVEQLARLGPAAVGRFLVELRVVLQVARDDLGWIPAAAWTGWPSLRTVEIDAHATLGRRQPIVDLRFDWAAALPRLRAASLRSPGLRCGIIEHPSLASLTVSMRGGFDPTLVEGLGRARLPALERLSVWLGRVAADQDQRAARSFTALISSATLGPIRELGLAAFALGPMALAELAASRRVRELERLWLTAGTIGDEHLPALRALIGEAKRLRELDLTRNYLSPRAVDELRSLFDGRLIADQQKPDGDRQVPVFGRYGLPDTRASS